MNVVFRADASLLIGSGHVMRCLALASRLRDEGHECLFVCREHEGHLGKRIISAGFELVLLTSSGSKPKPDCLAGTDYKSWLGSSLADDALETAACLVNRCVDWLVVDHYALDAEWEKLVVERLEVEHVLVIDDLANRDHQCDLLVDQNLGRFEDSYKGLIPSAAICLAGPKYALLRSEFLRWRPVSLQYRSEAKLQRIMISLGGVDADNVTSQILTAVAEHGGFSGIEFDVVLGERAPHLQQVRELQQRLPLKVTVSVNVSNMAERMSHADLVIGAAGGSAWERCCLGVPTALVILAENQRAGAVALSASGAAYLIAMEEGLSHSLAEWLERMKSDNCEALEAMSRAASQICDGQGLDRVLHHMLKITGGKNA
ncbi:polysaccharide biosynthesis protein [Alcanivorax nanhaiticus]|uniref:Polysaccharide biosynthesis protein n=1 Tax=Alcanivorax nanhaiticus TaxID=1177154 RepID=A0A095SGI4_9GAMM|nr:UDP-2,4-diacetamido-2,4,6-trideoxy-beta-L-altropyranose hydrolase [Alcanivorax nanhaiticus]KGD63459.1 polysaccharide biosynthesis protein [Alcanivorax nanhaiticus]